MSETREPLFPCVHARFLVRRRQALRALDWLALAVSLAGTEPFATRTLNEGWFRLNDARTRMESLVRPGSLRTGNETP